MKKLNLSIYRYDPSKDQRPYMADYNIESESVGNMMAVSYTHLRAHETQ